MSEVLNTVVQAWPEIVGGIAVGQGLEQMALRSIREHQLAHVRALKGGHDRVNMFRRATALLGMMGALAGYMYGNAFRSDPIAVHEQPLIGITADHTFGTGPGGDNTAGEISQLSVGIGSEKGLKSEYFDAHRGDVYSVQPAALTGETGYGPQNMADAVQHTIDTISADASPNQGSSSPNQPKITAAEVIVTDDDLSNNDPNSSSTTSPGDIVSYANQHGNMKVFAVNVGPNNDSTAAGLKYVAENTHGQYFHVSGSTSASQIASEIKADMSTSAVEHNNTSVDVPLLVAALGMTGMGLVTLKRRKKQGEQNYQNQ